MRVIAKRTLKEFWLANARAKSSIEGWYGVASKAKWDTPQHIKDQFRTADILPGNRVVFDIGGNAYRIVAKINYAYGILYVRFVGTHADYDKIDAETV